MAPVVSARFSLYAGPQQQSSRVEVFEFTGIEDGQVFKTQGATLEAVYTPGHTVDHVAFVLREEKVDI